MLSYPVVLPSPPSSPVLDSLPLQLVRCLLLTSVEYFVAYMTGLSDALIPMLRLIFTRGDFAKARWSNGRFSVPFCVISAIWNSTSENHILLESDDTKSRACSLRSMCPLVALHLPSYT